MTGRWRHRASQEVNLSQGDYHPRLVNRLGNISKVQEIYTSILTVQEVSVSSFHHGRIFGDYHSKMARLARIKGVTKEIALTAAKFEAAIIGASKEGKPKTDDARIADNRRRKFDCFHLATAVALGSGSFYAFDDKFEGRCISPGIPMRVLQPSERMPGLPFAAPASALGRPGPT